jgi:DNA-binding response OmpR family regulator
MNRKILIVEDDPGIQLSLKDEFESEGYDVLAANDGEIGFNMILDKEPDLVILDIMLPGIDGYEVCKRLRSEGNNTPVIMLTVKDKEIDKVLGLEFGADDYVTKPFSLRELLARVKSIFRRVEAQPEEIHTYTIGETEFDFKRYEARKRGQRIEYTPLEFRMLHLLIRKRREVLTRDEFLDHIWGEDNLVVTSRTIDSHIANIRKKLEEDPSNPRFITSIRGVGYKLND